MSKDQFKAACDDPVLSKQIEALGYKVVKGSYYEMRMRAGKK